MSAALPVGCGLTAQTTAAPATTSETTISACVRADKARTRSLEPCGSPDTSIPPSDGALSALI